MDSRNALLQPASARTTVKNANPVSRSWRIGRSCCGTVLFFASCRKNSHLRHGLEDAFQQALLALVDDRRIALRDGLALLDVPLDALVLARGVDDRAVGLLDAPEIEPADNGAV